MWSPKGTTLRVIRCPTLQVSQFLFPGQRSDTFLTDHVCCGIVWYFEVFAGINNKIMAFFNVMPRSWVGSYSLCSMTLMVISSSEVLVPVCKSTWCHTPEDCNLNVF